MSRQLRNSIIIFIATLAALLFVFRTDLRNFLIEFNKPAVPPEVSYSPTPTPSASPVAMPATSVKPSASPATTPFAGVNLAVPFSSQAPTGDWSLPFQEACEETSAILVNNFYEGKKLTPAQMVDEINRVVQWQKDNFGYYEHTTAAETAKMIREIYGYKKIEVKYGITIADIKAELVSGRPVIVPLAGRHVGNPYYTAPGPVYHMLVVKGITKDGDIITNDVGTRHGSNYVFNAQVFYEAIHDVPAGGSTWPAGVEPDAYILSGRKAMIVVYPN